MFSTLCRFCCVGFAVSAVVQQFLFISDAALVVLFYGDVSSLLNQILQD